MLFGKTNVPLEFALQAADSYADIFHDVEVDVIFEGPEGRQWKVPAFWAGDDTFRVRFAAPLPGRYLWRSTCTNPADAGLHGRTGELTIEPYDGHNPLYRHGRLQVADSRRTLQHADGTPFLWLADTWWMGLSPRLDWPHGFRTLVADRLAKGFSVIQIVAGPLPEYDAIAATWHPQQANEAGWPWEQQWARLNPRFYDLADLRIAFLVDQGLVPCVVGMWGYYLPFMGVERAKQHWRNLVARYGAYPVIWCIAGEVNMPTYSSNAEERETRRNQQEEGWTEVTGYLRQIDPYHNPITAHPSFPDSREMLRDETLVDIDMLQTGHGGYLALTRMLQTVTRCVAKQPPMPVINGEPSYENIMGGSQHEVQRLQFWFCMTSGTAGHTYGAQGIWAMNSRHEPYEDPPARVSWGDGFWQDAMHLPGSTYVGIGRRFFERYPWWRFAPRQEPNLPAGRLSAFATGIPGQVAVYYLPIAPVPEELAGMQTNRADIAPVTIEPGADYHAYFFNPRTGADIPIGAVSPDPCGRWTPPRKPTGEDWVLVLADRKLYPPSRPHR